MEVNIVDGGTYQINGSVLYPAFYENTSIFHLIIQGTFSKIPKCCFAKCPYLESVTIGDNIKTIDEYAFYGCKNLRSVNFSNSITSIGAYAFIGTLLSYKDPPVELEYIEENAFNGRDNEFVCKNKIERLHYLSSDCIQYANKTIPDSVRVVRSYAFYKSDITNITIPESVEYIGKYAFQYCGSLQIVTINAKNISFGKEVFDRCYNLTSINIHGNVLEFGVSCFSDSPSLTINYPSNRDKIIPGAYSGWHGTSIEIPEGIKEIGEHAFYDCKQLESIKIPSSVQKIGSQAFSKCSSLNSITLPNDLIEIGSEAFSGCNKLSTRIPSSVKSIGFNAFDYYANITVNPDSEFPTDTIPLFKYFKNSFGTENYTVPSNITKILSYAFYGCDLKSINLSNVVEIGCNAFANCPNLTNIYLPDFLIRIDSGAFYSCSNLNNITLPHNLQHFGEHVIDSTAITKLVIPDTVEYYGIQKYENVPLEYIKLPSNMKEIREKEFLNSKLKKIILPNNLETIGEFAFHRSSSLESIIIPKTVKFIYNAAFSDCTKLTNVTFLGNVKYFGSDCFGSTNITEIRIPNKATFFTDSINGCENLQKITFGDINNFSISLGNDGISYDHETQLNNLEVNYIGNDRNDYNVNFVLYDIIKKYAKNVTVKDTYELDTFCTKPVRIIHVEEKVCDCIINIYQRPYYQVFRPR